MPLPIYCFNFSQCTHRFPPHRSFSSLLLHTALPLISRRTTTSTGGIKTRCRGLCPSVLPAPLYPPCSCPMPRQRHLLCRTTFLCLRLPFHSVFGTFSPHLFIESVHGEIWKQKTENWNLNATPDQWTCRCVCVCVCVSVCVRCRCV